MYQLINGVKVHFTANDVRDFEKYKKIVGNRIIEWLVEHIVQKRNKTMVEYSDVSKLLRYDKRLKYNIYKFIGTIEDCIKQKLIDETYFSEGFKLKNEEDIDIDIDINFYFSTLEEINKVDKNKSEKTFYNIRDILEKLEELKLIEEKYQKTFENVSITNDNVLLDNK